MSGRQTLFFEGELIVAGGYTTKLEHGRGPREIVHDWHTLEPRHAPPRDMIRGLPFSKREGAAFESIMYALPRLWKNVLLSDKDHQEITAVFEEVVKIYEEATRRTVAWANPHNRVQARWVDDMPPEETPEEEEAPSKCAMGYADCPLFHETEPPKTTTNECWDGWRTH